MPRPKSDGPPKKRGQKPFEWTPALFKKIEQLAAQQLRQEDIAYCIGLNPSTLSEFKAKMPDLADAIKRGRAKGLADVTKALLAESKRKTGRIERIFIMKARGGWRDDGRSTDDNNDRDSEAVAQRVQAAMDAIRPSGEEMGAS
jgi:hypothetical protein